MDREEMIEYIQEKHKGQKKKTGNPLLFTSYSSQ